MNLELKPVAKKEKKITPQTVLVLFESKVNQFFGSVTKF